MASFQYVSYLCSFSMTIENEAVKSECVKMCKCAK